MADLSPLDRLVCDPDRFLRAWQRVRRPRAPMGRYLLQQRLFHKSDVLSVHSRGPAGPRDGPATAAAALPFAPDVGGEPFGHTGCRALRRPERSLTSWMSQAGSPSLLTKWLVLPGLDARMKGTLPMWVIMTMGRSACR